MFEFSLEDELKEIYPSKTQEEMDIEFKKAEEIKNRLGWDAVTAYLEILQYNLTSSIEDQIQV